MTWPSSMFSKPSHPVQTPAVPTAMAGQGTFALQLVGESHYQQALDRVCGGRTEEGHRRAAVAVLILEDDNEYDSKAVRIDIDGWPVGYLTRAKARNYRQRLADLGAAALRLSCPAEIRGGFLRDEPDGIGYYGVWLDLHLGKKPKRPAPALPHGEGV